MANENQDNAGNNEQAQGCTVVTGIEKLKAIRLITMWRALKFELETGTAICRIPVLPLIKKELGAGAPRTKLACYHAFSAYLADKGLLKLV